MNGDQGELRRLVEMRVPELVAYQDEAYARRYAELVRRVHVAEQERTPGHAELAEAVARQLFKLMAYKDEYEVARLHLDAVEQAKLTAEFGDGRQGPLQPASAAAAVHGTERKLKLGSWFVPSFRALCRMRRLRGTKLDPFGRAQRAPRRARADRRVRGACAEALARLTPDATPPRVELLELPDVIRGYEEIKLRNVALFRKRAESRCASRLTPRPCDHDRRGLRRRRVVARGPVALGPPAGVGGSWPNTPGPVESRRSPRRGAGRSRTASPRRA